MDEESKILARLKRRVAGTRGAVIAEFALVAPLIFSMAIFAMDFTRILRTEQQLEIAARLAADIESHMAVVGGGEVSPGAAAKSIPKQYLFHVAKVVDKTDYVYIKGDHMLVPNPVSQLITLVGGVLSGDYKLYGGDSKVLDFVVNTIVGGLLKVVGTFINLIMFQSNLYLTEICPHDCEVRETVAAYIPTLLPNGMYRSFALGRHTKPGVIGAWQSAPNLRTPEMPPSTFMGLINIMNGQVVVDTILHLPKGADSLELDKTHRHRVYCYMPVIDSVPIPPKTYMRTFAIWARRQAWMRLVN